MYKLFGIYFERKKIGWRHLKLFVCLDLPSYAIEDIRTRHQRQEPMGHGFRGILALYVLILIISSRIQLTEIFQASYGLSTTSVNDELEPALVAL